MEINYIQKGEEKLFSFFTHDFQQFETGEFIDGGWDYTRFSGELKTGKISDLIQDIRKQFLWTSQLDKDKNLLDKPVQRKLKDLDTDHIISILIHITEKSLLKNELNNKSWIGTKLILLEELKFRNESTR